MAGGTTGRTSVPLGLLAVSSGSSSDGSLESLDTSLFCHDRLDFIGRKRLTSPPRQLQSMLNQQTMDISPVKYVIQLTFRRQHLSKSASCEHVKYTAHMV